MSATEGSGRPIAEVDLVTEVGAFVKDRLAASGGESVDPTVDVDLTAAHETAGALNRIGVRLFHILERSVAAAADVKAGDPIVRALLRLYSHDELDRERLRSLEPRISGDEETNLADLIENLHGTTGETFAVASILHDLAEWAQRAAPSAMWADETPFAEQQGYEATPALVGMILVEALRQQGHFDESDPDG